MIYISPTRLQRWFELGCPARWNFERNWEPKAKNEWAERGTLVHAMLDGSKKLKDVKDLSALRLYQKLKDALAFSDLEIESMELEQTIPIKELEDVMLVRRIDVKGKLNGQSVLLDYKTAGVEWKSIGDIVPQTYTFQGPGYLYPPPDLPEWPTTMHYLVVPLYRGTVHFHPYHKNAPDDLNFLEAVKMLRDAIIGDYQPKIRGKGCLDCDMAPVCYDIPGWKKLYTPKEHHHGTKPAPVRKSSPRKRK